MVQILRKLSDSENDFCRIIAEIISDIREGFDGTANMSQDIRVIPSILETGEMEGMGDGEGLDLRSLLMVDEEPLILKESNNFLTLKRRDKNRSDSDSEGGGEENGETEDGMRTPTRSSIDLNSEREVQESLMDFKKEDTKKIGDEEGLSSSIGTDIETRGRCLELIVASLELLEEVSFSYSFFQYFPVHFLILIRSCSQKLMDPFFFFSLPLRGGGISIKLLFSQSGIDDRN